MSTSHLAQSSIMSSSYSAKGAAGRSFWQLMSTVALSSALVHVMFAVLFYALGAWIPTIIEFFSIGLFVSAFVLLKRRINFPAILLIIAEVILHAAFAVRAVGWESGFHYYLIVTFPIIAVSSTRTPKTKLLLAVGVCLYYILIDALLRPLTPYHQFSPTVLSSLRYFNMVSSFTLLSYLAAVYYSLITRAERRLQLMATTDPLTKLFNRRHILEIAQYEISRSKRIPCPLTVVLADVDHFKSINDRYGHEIGDRVLLAISQVMHGALREQDCIARWGGEEFLILLPNTSTETAMVAVERIRAAIADVRVPCGETSLRVSMTFGVSGFKMEDDGIDRSISRADAALYRGKQAGRDRVVLSAE